MQMILRGFIFDVLYSEILLKGICDVILDVNFVT